MNAVIIKAVIRIRLLIISAYFAKLIRVFRYFMRFQEREREREKRKKLQPKSAVMMAV